MTNDLDSVDIFTIYYLILTHWHTQEKNWKNRRSQKLDKMEILNLQSSLQSEIQAKESIREELTQIRADFIAMQKYLCSIITSLDRFVLISVFVYTENCGK